MSRVEVQNVIKLQLKKPRSWNWELNTLNTSSSIPLPIIQLYDNKKQLLVETKPFERRSWSGYNTKDDKNIPQRTNSSNKLDISDRIKIKECLLKKSRSDLLNNDKIYLRKYNRSASDDKFEDYRTQNQLYNSDAPKQRCYRSKSGEILHNSIHNSNNTSIKKSNSIGTPNDIPRNYQLRRSFKRIGLQNIDIIEEEQENKNKNVSASTFDRYLSEKQSVIPDELKNRESHLKNKPKNLSKQNFQDIKSKELSRNICHDEAANFPRVSSRSHRRSASESLRTRSSSQGSQYSEINYSLVTSNAGTLLVKENSDKDNKKRRRRRSQLRNIESSSDDEDVSPVKEVKRRSRNTSRSRSVNSVDSLRGTSANRRKKESSSSIASNLSSK